MLKIKIVWIAHNVIYQNNEICLKKRYALTEKSSLNLHASAVSLDGKGILIIGVSGSGKSKLALALINSGAILVSDDQVILNNHENEIILSAPKAIIAIFEPIGQSTLTRFSKALFSAAG